MAAVLTCLACGLILYLLWRTFNTLIQGRISSGTIESSIIQDEKQKDPYMDIQPLPELDWTTTPPIRNSPLKPKYDLTMALENITLSDIIAMDNTYATRMQVRRTIMDEHPSSTIQCAPICEPAVLELHDWIFKTYLPIRFPKTYTLQSETLLNKANNTLIPLSPSSAMTALRSFGENVDTDFLLLLPSSQSPDGLPIYHLQAFICCFPSGFSLRQKLGMPLAEIHTPVPGYKAKLEKSMDRFFARLECGKAVKRSNWAITTVTDLFMEEGTHFHDGKGGDGAETSGEQSGSSDDALREDIERQKAEVVVESCRLRSERQTLFRLPKSKAIVFSFKTYQYSLKEVKEEGYGEELARAIEGLEEGNVPEMKFYKRGVVWEEAVLRFLRN